MHFFRFHVQAQSKPESAFVNCWIEQPSREAAESRARQMITQSLWTIEALKDYRIVTAADYPDGIEGRKYYEQACIDREVLVYHTWPSSPRT